jgi:hypothetical protein
MDGTVARSDTSPLRRTFPIPGGPPVRLRMAGPSDRELLAGLLELRGLPGGRLDVQRLLAFDPARRHVFCALAPLDGTEVLAGFGAIGAGADAPDMLVVDERFGPGLADLLGRVLTERARPRRRAA